MVYDALLIEVILDELGIHSIFRSTEGEGVWVGCTQIFVRFQGCHIGCVNCDSKETWDFGTANRMSLDTVLSKIQSLGGDKIKRVAITGGDPLHPKHAPQAEILAKHLKKKGYFVSVEAAGTRVVDSLFDVIDYVNFDIKTPSTGVNFSDKPLRKLIEQYPSKSQVKAVIANDQDLEMVESLYNKIDDDNKHRISWVLTPCYEKHESIPGERVQALLATVQERSLPFRVILQQHKVVYGAQTQDV